MIIGGAVLLSLGMRPTAAEIWGKVATNVFYIGMILILAFGKNGALCELTGLVFPDWLTWTIVAAAAVCTLISLLGYAPGFIRQIKENKSKKAD